MAYLDRSPTRSSGFSLEMKSKKHLKEISLSNGPHEAVLIEGDLGQIKGVSFFEDKVLVIEGRHGILRVELPPSALSLNRAKDNGILIDDGGKKKHRVHPSISP